MTETVDSNLFTVETVKKEPKLAINESLLAEAKEMSKDPEQLENTVKEIVASINEKSDDYMNLPGFDGGEFDTEVINANAGMEDIAAQLNKSFEFFLTNEKATTDKMLADISAIDGKVAKILFDYRDPTFGDSSRETFLKATSSDWQGNTMPGSKRIKK